MRRSAPFFGWITACALLLASGSAMVLADWSRFRGPNGTGVSDEAVATPTQWSPTENLKWKVELPGPGSSSPIIVGDKIFITSWSGYGTDRTSRGGDQKDLKRHLTCLDRTTGKVIWDKTVDAYLPEDNFGGMFAEHGYATHTPVSDGERVYVFFGKTGAVAFDMDGKQLWKKQLGTDSNRMNWGSGSSPILYKDLLIVPASMESQTLYGLNKKTGEEVWKAPADALGDCWGTPILVEDENKRTDLVIGVPDEIWGFNPETGKLRWYCEALQSRNVSSSVVTDGKVVYAMGEQGSGSVAVRAGGTKDVTKTHIVWTGRDSNRIGSPVVADGKLYYVANRIANCVDAKTGNRIWQGRLAGGSAPVAQEEENSRPGRGGFGGGFGGGGRGGGRGGQDYSSPIVAGGKLYFVARSGDCYVLKTGDKFELLSTNRVTADNEDFSATPAVSHGELFLRSNKYLYCVAEGAKK